MKIIGFLFVALFIAFSSLSPAKLKDPSNKADYIIISTSEFENDLTNFINWRSSKGLKVVFCKIDDVYSEFSDSESKQESIRSFITYAIENWQSPKPLYVLLAGGVNFIPSFKIKSDLSDYGEDSLSSDRLFGVIGSIFDVSPSVFVSRIPARTNQELSEFLAKTINFEDNFSFSKYALEATFLVENRKEDGNVFEQTALNIQKNNFSSSKTKFLVINADSIDPNVKVEYVQSINHGSLFVSNFMHGNSKIWGYSKIFSGKEIYETEFSGSPFIFSTITSNQNCNNPDTTTLLEQSLIKGSSGAVASFTPASLNYLSVSNEIIDSFLKNLILKRVKTFREAIIDIPQSNLYVYYGDPALQNPYYSTAGLIEPDINNEISVFPNPASDKIGVKFNSNSNGNVRIGIYGILGNQIADFGDYQSNPNNQTIFFNLENFQIGLYLLKIQTENKTFIKQFLKTN